MFRLFAANEPQDPASVKLLQEKKALTAVKDVFRAFQGNIAFRDAYRSTVKQPMPTLASLLAQKRFKALAEKLTVAKTALQNEHLQDGHFLSEENMVAITGKDHGFRSQLRVRHEKGPLAFHTGHDFISGYRHQSEAVYRELFDFVIVKDDILRRQIDDERQLIAPYVPPSFTHGRGALDPDA